MESSMQIDAPLENVFSEVGAYLDKRRDEQISEFYFSPHYSSSGYTTSRGYHIEYKSYLVLDIDFRSLSENTTIIEFTPASRNYSEWECGVLTKLRKEIAAFIKNSFQDAHSGQRASREIVATNTSELLIDPKWLSKLRKRESKEFSKTNPTL
jgi:hypothetical protein